MSVIGEGAQARIAFGASGQMFVPTGASVARLDLSRTSGGGVVILLQGTGSHLGVESPSSIPVQVGVDGLLLDSFVHGSDPTAPAVQGHGLSAKLRNVTALADGAAAAAVRVLS